MKQKILFLDFDGVLNTLRWREHEGKNAIIDRFGYSFDPLSVANLAKVVSCPDVGIVVSSSWKCLGLDEMRNLWKERNMPGELVDITPSETRRDVISGATPNEIRWLTSKGYEIDLWLAQHGNISNYVIVDDEDTMLPEQQSHFVKISPIVGITDDDVRRMKSLLKID
jgi:hypothetical protein